MPKMVGISWLGAAPQIGEYNLKNFSYYPLPYLTLLFLTLPFLFLYASTGQTAKPICTLDGSNDAVSREEMPFGGRIDTESHFGVKTAKIPNFQPNQYTRISFERCEIDEKFQRTAYTKSGSIIEESNDDVISAVGRHLAANATSG
jgi:hypothetical protein